MAEFSDVDRSLIARAQELVAALARVPEVLEDEAVVARAMLYARQLDTAAKAVRAARLAALKALKAEQDATAAPYKTAEAALAETRAEIARRLEAAVRFHAPEVEDHDPLVEVEPAAMPPMPASDASAPDAPPAAADPVNPPPGAAVPVVWRVGEVDRQAVDLDALRAHFTDAELIRAATRHLKENGPHAVRGVRYERGVSL